MKNRLAKFFYFVVLSEVMAGLFLIAGITQAETVNGTVQAHHVQLKSDGEDEEKRLGLLHLGYDVCKSARQINGLEAPPPFPVLPGKVHDYQTDIYYAANRTVTITRGMEATIDTGKAGVTIGTCTLKMVPIEGWSLYSSAGECKLRTNRGVAELFGQCDIAAHERAVPGNLERSVSPVALSKVPPQYREQVKKAYADADKATTPVATKTILGVPCSVYAYGPADQGGIQKCVADLSSDKDHRLTPYPIPYTTAHIGLSGLLLEVYAKDLVKETAIQIDLSKFYPASLFALPPGIPVKQINLPIPALTH